MRRQVGGWPGGCGATGVLLCSLDGGKGMGESYQEREGVWEQGVKGHREC